MSEIAEFILAQYDRIEAAAWAAAHEMGDAPNWWAENRSTVAVPIHDAATGVTKGVFTVARTEDVGPAVVDHIAHQDPAFVLTDIASKRQIIDVVMSWQHEYIDGDTWFSCGLAESPDFPGEGPGSGCADDSKRGTCDCGLEYRQRRILAPLAALAAPFSAEPGYKPEWAV